MESTQRNKKENIVNICKRILLQDIDIIEGMREIYTPGLKEFIEDKRLWTFCTLFEDETETIPKGNSRKYCSASLLKEKDEEEKVLLDFYKKDVKEFASSTIKLLEKQLNTESK
jgi:hypothetical protein